MRFISPLARFLYAGGTSYHDARESAAHGKSNKNNPKIKSTMFENSNYPAGAEHDPRAPYNQVEQEPIEAYADISFLITASAPIDTLQYFDEMDDECRQPYHVIEYTRDESIREFRDFYFTPVELLAKYRTALESRLWVLQRFGDQNSFDVRNSISKCKSLIASVDIYDGEEIDEIGIAQ